MSAVAARGLTKRYEAAGSREGFVAVDGIDLEVPAHRCFGILGPNGAGKTTTMKMIYGRVPLTSGALRVLDLPVPRELRRIKQRLGVVPQEDNLDPDLTVRENLLVYARYFDIPAREVGQRADQLLQFVQLEEKAGTAVDKLSGGMKRRLVIARALINRPDLVILDEPTTGLDPQARHLLWQKLRQLRDEGVTLLLTTHYLEEAEQLCDELVIMDRGRILARGAPAELVARHAGSDVVELRLPPQQQELVRAAAQDLVATAESVGELLLLYTADGPALLHRVEQLPVTPRFSLLRRATLEDVFLRLTGRVLNEE